MAKRKKGKGAGKGGDKGDARLESDDIHAFYAIEQTKLQLDFAKIGLFTKHPGTLGAFREARLREYIRQLTPGAISVESGLVAEWNKGSGRIVDKHSRQIDLLVFDRTQTTPLLDTSDFVIIEPRSLFAAIEVKSTLTMYRETQPAGGADKNYPLGAPGKRWRWAGTMIDAIRNIATLVKLCVRSGFDKAPFLSVFAYDIAFEPRILFGALDNNEIQLQLDIKHVDELPGSICVPGRVMILFGGWDMFEKMPHHDVHTSFMNMVEAMPSHPAYPLQLFSTMYKNQVQRKLTGREPDHAGLFSASNAVIGSWSKHFDLNSSGYEDQD